MHPCSLRGTTTRGGVSRCNKPLVTISPSTGARRGSTSSFSSLGGHGHDAALPSRVKSLDSYRRRVVARSSDGVMEEGKAPLRFIQHKNEAKAFYAFLAQVYDYIVNPGHWTTEMRDAALVPADLSNPNLTVCDVGGGTGFCTQGIVETIPPTQVTLLDQSPHQLSKARGKKDLQGVTILEGDAEDLPFETDSYDRYVSAGSIEYWPDPQRGICEAYRVLREGGKACVIGPVHPTHALSRFMADAWMLFPTEEEYVKWFEAAGFEEVEVLRIGPSWYRGVRYVFLSFCMSREPGSRGHPPVECGDRQHAVVFYDLTLASSLRPLLPLMNSPLFVKVDSLI